MEDLYNEVQNKQQAATEEANRIHFEMCTGMLDEAVRQKRAEATTEAQTEVQQGGEEAKGGDDQGKTEMPPLSTAEEFEAPPE